MSQPRVFVINLDRSSDRLDQMSRHLSLLGIVFERFPAIEGRRFSGEVAEQFAAATLLSAGEIGCYASHLAVAKRVVDEKLAYAIVLEDDVTVAPDLTKACADVINAAPLDWHIIHIAAKPKRSAIRLARLAHLRDLVKFSRVPTNAAGYLISYTGAQKLIEPRNRTLPIDVEMRHHALSGLDVYGVLPSLVVQNTLGSSTIGTYRHKTRVTPAQKLREAWHLYSKIGLLKYLAVSAANIDGAMRRLIFHDERIRIL